MADGCCRLNLEAAGVVKILGATIAVLAAAHLATQGVKYGFGLAALFLVLSVDEMVGLHEMAIVPTKRLLPDLSTGLLYWPWMIPGAVAVAIVVVVFCRFVVDDMPRRPWR